MVLMGPVPGPNDSRAYRPRPSKVTACVARFHPRVWPSSVRLLRNAGPHARGQRTRRGSDVAIDQAREQLGSIVMNVMSGTFDDRRAHVGDVGQARLEIGW